MSFTETLQGLTGKPLADCTNQELYLALLELVRQKSADRVQPVTGRKLYYISAEFLIGKLLSNNLINLGLYDEARDALAAVGKSLSDIEEVEPEPSLRCKVCRQKRQQEGHRDLDLRQHGHHLCADPVLHLYRYSSDRCDRQLEHDRLRPADPAAERLQHVHHHLQQLLHG